MSRATGTAVALIACMVAGALSSAVAQDIITYIDRVEFSLPFTQANREQISTAGTPSNRTWWRGDGEWAGVGLADAAHDLLTATTSTMSSTYQTLLSAVVDVPEQGDRVLIDVTAQLGRMGGGLFITESDNSELWMFDGADVSTGTGQDLPSGLTFAGPTATNDGTLYVVNISGTDRLWRIPDPTTPGTGSQLAAFPAGLTAVLGLAFLGDVLFAIGSGDNLWRIPDADSPGVATSASLPAGLDAPAGMAFLGDVLFVSDDAGDNLWRIPDADSPGVATSASLPAGLDLPAGMAFLGDVLFVADDAGDELWRIPDVNSPGVGVGTPLPSGITSPRGMTAIGEGPCDIRIARGTTDVETIELNDGRIWLDATVVDEPSAGSHTYTLQHKTSDPNTVCTAYLGNGAVPMPSMLITVSYGE